MAMALERRAARRAGLLAGLTLGFLAAQQPRATGQASPPAEAQAGAARGATIFTLEVPELGARVPGNSVAILDHLEFGAFRIVIDKSPSRVNYGDIHARINTEAANIVMTVRSTREGLVADFDLNRRAGFRLRPGRNSVEIELQDIARRRAYASFLLRTSQTAKEVLGELGAQVQPLQGQIYAVVAGVSRYANAPEGIPNLRYADSDATAMRDFLQSPLGGSVRPQNMVFMTNEQATSQALRSALFTFLTRPEPEDLVVIYFAGHGAPDPNDPRNLYLLTHDTRIADFGGTAFPMWQLQDVLGRVIRAKRVVVLTDACHSEGIGGAQYGSTTINLVNQYLARYAQDAQHAVMTASDISESSLEDARWGGGHGVFTSFLLEGLRGAADANRDGVVTAGELFPYVRQSVQQATDGAQNPQSLPGFALGLPLATARKAAMAIRSPFRRPDGAAW